MSIRYYWCHKNTTLWGYCTPQFLYDKTVEYAMLVSLATGGRASDASNRPPRAFTVYGEACIDDCQSSGETYTW